MSKGLTPGAVLPDFTLPDEKGTMRRLSELQGDDAMILMLGRGEHCPRERQHQREMLVFHQWCAVPFSSGRVKSGSTAPGVSPLLIRGLLSVGEAGRPGWRAGCGRCWSVR